MTTEAAALAAGRALAETRMVDTVRVLVPGTPVYDPAIGATTAADGRVAYEGKARVKPAAAVSESAQTGQRLVVQRRYEVALPWSATAFGEVVPGMQVAVDTSPDPRLAGRVLWVTSVAESATATAWRIAAEDRS